MFSFHPSTDAAAVDTRSSRVLAEYSSSSRLRQRNSVLRRYRICVLMALTLIGLGVLALEHRGTAPARGTERTSHSSFHGLASHSEFQAMHALVSTGAGAGNSMHNSTENRFHSSTDATTPSITCVNPLDPTCWTQQVAQWIAGQILNALHPVIDAINQSSLNILTQTPAANTYQNAMVVTLWRGFVQVVDIALACIIVIGGYNVMLSQQIGMTHSTIAEFLPRVILAVLAAHFSLYFIGLFIDLENALCSVARNLAGLSMLTSTLVTLFQGNLLGAGLLVWVLALVLGVMDILLGVQMIVRLALLLVLIVLAGPALACLSLPQTLRFGRLWLSLFAATVMVQLFQVVALALGGVLVASLGTGNLLHIDSTLATLFVSIAVFSLVLRIPGMLNTWALRPMMEASTAVSDTAQGAASYAARVAPRLLALL